MVLSIGMIVKNEEKYLEKCLTAIKPILEQVDSELIIADTGSTDRTVEIAKKFTDNVFYFEWINDFAAARNATLERAKGEWYMFIDGDEIAQDCSGLINFFNSGAYKKCGSATYIQRNYADLENRNDYTDAHVIRVTKKTDDLKFRRPIHEGFSVIHNPTMPLQFVVDHYGYIFVENEEVTDLAKQKSERNLKLLMKDLETLKANGEDKGTMVYTQIADCYAAVKEYDKALKYAMLGFELSDPDSYVSIAYYDHILSLLHVLKRFDEELEWCDKYFSAENLVRKEQLVTDSRVHFSRAFIYYHRGKYDKALPDIISGLDIYIRYKNNQIFTRDMVSVVFNATAARIKMFSSYMHTCCRKTGEYAGAADVLRRFLYAKEFTSDETFMRAHLYQRVEIMEHTSFAPLVELYHKLDEKNKEVLVSIMAWAVFRIEDPGQAVGALKRIAGSSKRTEDLIRIYDYFFVRKNLSLNAVKSYISKYKTSDDERILCILLRSNFDTSLITAAEEFNAEKIVYSVYRHINNAPDFFAKYDINAISPEGLENAASMYKWAMFGAQQNGADIAPLLERFGAIGARWFKSFPNAESFPEDITAALIANVVTAARNAGNYELCYSELDRLAGFPQFEQIADEYKMEMDSDLLPPQHKIFVDAESIEEAAKLLAEYEALHPEIEEIPANPLSEFEKLAQQLKQNIRALINAGNIEEACALLAEYEQLCPNDQDINKLKQLI